MPAIPYKVGEPASASNPLPIQIIASAVSLGSGGGGSSLAETLWTDNTAAIFIRLDDGTTVTWHNMAGTLTPAPGVGAKPYSGSTAGAALDASILTGNASLATIATKISSNLTISNGSFGISGNLPSFASTPTFNIGTSPLALETGGNLASIATNVSTAANQTTGNTALSSILTKATAIAASLAGTLTTALAAGSNIIGYAGSLNFQTAPVVPTIQAAAYATGNVIGGKQTVSVFRNTTQPSATLSQFLLGWAGTETVAVTAYLFSKNPTNSTITDKAAFVLAAADAQYLVTAPFTLTASASAGSTQTFTTQSLSLSAQNRDVSVTQNLYVVLVAGGAVTPAVGDLFFSISGVQD